MNFFTGTYDSQNLRSKTLSIPDYKRGDISKLADLGMD